MYEKYFGFNSLPFNITPDPRYFYDNPSCREALASLCYGIEGRKGLIVITGEPGSGKTRLVKDFIQRAEVRIRTAYITTPRLTVTELLHAVLTELGTAPSTQDQAALTLQLKNFLVEQLKKNNFVALVVDEAQQLSNEMLEELRLLSNLETNEYKLIQIVLVGQPELEERLEQPELRQLTQRIALRCRLVPLKDQDVYFYIQARLKTAGLKDMALFNRKAVAKIALYSNGIPRLINVICDSALLMCYALSKKNVSADIIEEVARDLQLCVQRPNKKFHANHNDPAKVSGKIARQRSLARLASGFILGVFAAAGVSAIYYSQSNRHYLSVIAARIREEINWREPVKTGAEEPGALHEVPPQELKDVQPMASEIPLISTHQPEESSVEAKARPILEASKIGPSPAADALNRSQEKQPVKNYDKNEKVTRTAAKGISKASASDRLEFDIHRAIAKHAIRGVEVSVIDDIVFLGGRVDTENQKIAAAKAASNVPGVKYIRDQIIVNDDVAS